MSCYCANVPVTLINSVTKCCVDTVLVLISGNNLVCHQHITEYRTVMGALHPGPPVFCSEMEIRQFQTSRLIVSFYIFLHMLNTE